MVLHILIIVLISKIFSCSKIWFAMPHHCYFPVSLWVQFKVVVIIFRALYSTGLGYLWECLSLRPSAHTARSSRIGILWITRSNEVGKLQVPILKSCHLVGPRKHAFSIVAFALRNTVPLEIWQAPNLLAFQKAIKS